MANFIKTSVNEFKDWKENANQTLVKQRILNIIFSIFRYIFVITIGFVIIYPLISMVSTAFTAPAALGNPAGVYIPVEVSTFNFEIANELIPLFRTMVISLLYAALMTLCQIAASAFIGYGFARFKFRGKNLLFICMMITIVIPPQTLIIPEYLSFRYFDIFGIFNLLTGAPLNLLGQPIVLVLKALTGVGIRGGIFIFIFRQFFMGIPKELEEAAMVDGAGVFKTFFTIIMPSATPAMITVGVFSFVWNYSDTALSTFTENGVVFSQLLLSELTPAKVEGAYNTLMGTDVMVSPLLTEAVRNAALMVYLIPLLILYFMIQRKFVENFERAGIVG